MLLLDTDVLIVQREHAPALAWFASLTELPVVPGFVVMELMQDARNARELRAARKLVMPFRIVWPTQPDCAQAMNHFEAYHLSHNLGLIDSLVASCAIGLRATLLTFNDKHYRAVPGLLLAQPYVR